MTTQHPVSFLIRAHFTGNDFRGVIFWSPFLGETISGISFLTYILFLRAKIWFRPGAGASSLRLQTPSDFFLENGRFRYPGSFPPRSINFPLFWAQNGIKHEFAHTVKFFLAQFPDVAFPFLSALSEMNYSSFFVEKEVLVPLALPHGEAV